ncbi:MAG: ATP-binding protein [Desulfatitalea sp.]
MFQRNLLEPMLNALADTPVVFLRGARQSGKSTLVQTIANGPYRARYVTLDNAGFLTAAGADPTGFIAGLEKPVVIDEAQRVPGLFLAIKEDVDRNRRPGQYLLTGSADPLALPTAARELVGRMEVRTLWPLSTGEIAGKAAISVERFFNADFPKGLRTDPAFDLATTMVAGGFPEPVQRTTQHRRTAWFESYITTILDRDIRHLSQIQDLTAVPRLLQLLAGRTATLHNQSELSRAGAIPNTTLSRYMALLKNTFLIQELPAWSANLGKRLVKAPKLFLVDTGLACHLLALDEKRLKAGGEIVGRIFENFVVLELFKQLSWAAEPIRLYHFRSQAGKEVDVVIEAPDGRIVGVEIKLSATPAPQDFSGLKTLKEHLGKKWVRGLLVYTGREVVPFGESLHAVPVSTLFAAGA